MRIYGRNNPSLILRCARRWGCLCVDLCLLSRKSDAQLGYPLSFGWMRRKRYDKTSAS